MGTISLVNMVNLFEEREKRQIKTVLAKARKAGRYSIYLDTGGVSRQLLVEAMARMCKAISDLDATQKQLRAERRRTKGLSGFAAMRQKTREDSLSRAK